MTLWSGAPYEYSRRAGSLLFTAGACPLDDAGKVVGIGDLEAQASRATENLVAALSEEGVGIEALVKTTIYVVAHERADLVRAWNVMAKKLGRTPSTLLGVTHLGYPDQLVEIEAVAYVGAEAGS